MPLGALNPFGAILQPFRDRLSQMLQPGGGPQAPLPFEAMLPSERPTPPAPPPPDIAASTSDDLRPDARAIVGPTRPQQRPQADVGPSDIEGYIRYAAARRGIDPNIAVRVAKSEGGLQSWNRQSDVVKNGKRERSYGPFQLYIDGGLGNRALAAGIDPRDPAMGKAAVDFALDEVAQKGWGQWYGAAKVGIGNYDGIRGAKALGSYAEADPSLRDGTPYAVAGGPLSGRVGGLDLPENTQTLPTSNPRRRSEGGGFESQQSEGLQAPERRTPMARAAEAYKVNKTTRLLRGLSPAATIGVLAAIGADIRSLKEQANAQSPSTDD